MAYVPAKHGRAEYGSWMQVADDFTNSILPSVEGSESTQLKDQKFAQLVYIVNPSAGAGGSNDLAPVLSAVNIQTLALENSIANQTNELAVIAEDQIKAIAVMAEDQNTALNAQTLALENSIANQTNALTPGLTELIIDNTYSRIIQTIGTATYIAQAPSGSSQAASVWRVQKIDVNGSRSWAGTGVFNQPANDVASLTYNY